MVTGGTKGCFCSDSVFAAERIVAGKAGRCRGVKGGRR